jgi:prevent-host-death family protein
MVCYLGRMDEIGIRELRQHASRYVAAASAGESITVTDRGTPVARLVPLSPLEAHLADVIRRHEMIPPTRPRRRHSAGTRLTGPPLSPLLAQGREERLA